MNLLRAGARASPLSAPDRPSLQPSRDFTELVDELESVVESGDRDKSDRLLLQLRQQYPVPAVDFLAKEIWGTEMDQLVLKTHGPLNIEEAVHNAEATGRKLTAEEIKYLELIATHWCAWSPTPSDHQDDEWVLYLRHAYSSLAGLQPILDSLIWQDEISRYPIGHVPRPPWLFLLATKDDYFVYNFQDYTMLKAGKTMMEVFDGMMKFRWADDMWEMIPRKGMKDPCDYFPVYDNVKHTTQHHPLQRPMKSFTA